MCFSWQGRRIWTHIALNMQCYADMSHLIYCVLYLGMYLHKSSCNALIQCVIYLMKKPQCPSAEMEKKNITPIHIYMVHLDISIKRWICTSLANSWLPHAPFFSNHSHACFSFLGPLLFVSFSLSPPVLRHSRKCCWRSLACGSGQAASTGQKFPVSTGSHGGGEPLPIHRGRQWEKYTSRPNSPIALPRQTTCVATCCSELWTLLCPKVMQLTKKLTTG